jgi:hypothetical protein
MQRNTSYPVKRYERFKLSLSYPQPAHGGRMVGRLDHVLKMARLDKEVRLYAVTQPSVQSMSYFLLFHQSPGIACFASTGGPSNTMHVFAHIYGRVIVDDMFHVFNIHSA